MQAALTMPMRASTEHIVFATLLHVSVAHFTMDALRAVALLVDLALEI
jgi:hypothetical protein